MEPQLVRLSKFLSRTLRHRPQAIGLTLDQNGWVQVDELLAGAARAHVPLTRELLERVVAENDKQRYAFNADHTKLRANQGHTVRVDLELAPQAPPEILYHGTSRKSLASIRAQGLHPGKRMHVHLSGDTATATRVGARHGSPVVLRVEASRMHAQNFVFYCAVNGVWLTERVPREFIGFPPEE
ncbi:RNA 2'-phosphotransferase [Anaerolineae bacterium CFX7]|nr:RNA 2'-phosphotransferase [Anaerolineae bacterium CFX7]